MADAQVRVLVEAFEGEQPFVLPAEPWGQAFDIAPGRPAVVTFRGDGERRL